MRYGTWMRACSCAVAIGAVVLTAHPLRADDQEQSQQKSNEAPRTLKAIDRASATVGKEVRNLQDEKLGVIKDIVIDSNGWAKFVVVDHGGILTDKYVAVPINAIQKTTNPEYCAVDMAVGKFQAAPTFTRGNYNERWTKEWCDKTCTYFGAAKQDKQSPEAELFYSSQLIGGTAQNKDQQKLASIDDLICDGNHRVAYAILGSGGVLKIGRSQIAVPFGSIALKKGEQGSAFATIDLTQAQLESAPKLTRENFADLLNREYVAANDLFFGVKNRSEIEAEVPADRPNQK